MKIVDISKAVFFVGLAILLVVPATAQVSKTPSSSDGQLLSKKSYQGERTWTGLYSTDTTLKYPSSSAGAAWHGGIGTGLARMNAEGDQGLNLGALGPVQVEIDLSPDDFSDYMESAIGFGGYLTNGNVVVQFSFAQINLGGDPSGTLPSGATYDGEWSFDITAGELTAGYPIYRHPQGKIVLQPYVGVRYLKHDLGAELIVVAETTTEVSRGIDHSWTDAIIGAATNVGVSPKVRWVTRTDVGFGGSSGSLAVATALAWTPLSWLTLSPNAFFKAIDFENGEKGDADWYLYDANEFGWGLAIMIHIF